MIILHLKNKNEKYKVYFRQTGVCRECVIVVIVETKKKNILRKICKLTIKNKRFSSYFAQNIHPQ